MADNQHYNADTIEMMIINDGYIDNNQLWRKWIMVQMLRSYFTQDKNPNFYETFISNKTYAYAWEILTNEVEALSKLTSSELAFRSKFFNTSVVMDMIDRYSKDAIRRIMSMLSSRKSITLSDVTIINDNVECSRKKNAISISAFQKKVYNYTYAIQNCCNQIDMNKKTYKQLYMLLKDFTRECVISLDLDKPQSWINAFTGSGAYYTMDNLIKFHDCHIYENGTPLSTMESIDSLKYYVEKYKDDYKGLFDKMLMFLQDNQTKIEDVISKNL